MQSSHHPTKNQPHACHGSGMTSQAEHHAMSSDFLKRFWICLILTLPILILSPMIQHAFHFQELVTFSGDTYLLALLSSVLFFYGGKPFLEGLFQEVKSRNLGMMSLIGTAISAAYVYSLLVTVGLEGSDFFWELVTLIDIMLLGHWIEMKAIMGAGDALDALAKLLPATAHQKHPDGSFEDVPLSTLQKNDLVLVKPGEKVPVDGKILEGSSSLNEALLTGESKPVYKTIGNSAIGGSLNGEGSLLIRATHLGENSLISQMMLLVKQAQESKSKTQDLANRSAKWLTIIALSSGAFTFLTWLLIFNDGLAFALERMVTVMVVACPHALGLAIPLVVAVSTTLAATHGLLIKNRPAFETARNIQALIFDKTGTLTKGEFEVTDTIVFDAHFSKEELLTYAASLESHSEHPLAKAITQLSNKLLEVEDFKAIPGKGAQGKISGHIIKIVSPGYLKEHQISLSSSEIQNLKSQAKTIVFILKDDNVIGALALADSIRPEAKLAISKLQEMGIKCLMLTGDNPQVAHWVAQELGLDEVFAETLPQGKVEKVKEVQSRGLIVGMIGDGVNDAPALAQADVGIAIGAGTDIALAAADIILVRSNPLDVVTILNLARITYRKIIQNLLWATGYNVFAIPAASGLFMTYGLVLTPAIGAILMSLSTVICAINARILKLDHPKSN